LRTVAFERCGFDRAAYLQRFTWVRVADPDTPGGRLHRQRRLRKNPARQHKEQRGNRSNHEAAVVSIDVAAKHSRYLLIWRD
jgi:hypothetical protein